MCGIFAILNNSSYSYSDIEIEFMKGIQRGPENSKLDDTYIQMILGFHRLAINGLNELSNQPLVIKDIILICNGEIYNFNQLYKDMNITPKTQSDCEVIIHLYIKYGIEQTLVMLDGVFSFVLFDNRITSDSNNKIYFARDPFGVRPLYYLKNNHNNMYAFASELKCLEKFYNDYFDCDTIHNEISIQQFTPGTFSTFNLSNNAQSVWQLLNENTLYFIPTFSYNTSITNNIFNLIAESLNSAVKKRCISTERPIACLLSGGLDSSLITALVHNYYCLNKIPYKLETYSIGLSGSQDLKYAKIVADYLQTNHTEIIITEDEIFDAIPEVIYAIESYDTTTVRASICNYLLGKYIKSHSNAKVIFNGDGADELFGGYIYMNKCPDNIEFDKEIRRLLKDIHLFDVLRSDKCISSHGLEPRTPFLDKSLVNLVLSISPGSRNHNCSNPFFNTSIYNHREKNILRYSFMQSNFYNYQKKQLLPMEILWRQKEAFSDGVSLIEKSLYQILQDKISIKLNSDNPNVPYESNISTEKYYYFCIFSRFFPNCKHLLPYLWMPKYTNATDPSARTLTFYK